MSRQIVKGSSLPVASPLLPERQENGGLPHAPAAPTARATTHRASTLVSHFLAIERVLRTVTQDLSEPISLQGMAEIASVSPYHFNRIFRAITGVPPLRFLSALRIAEAKRLLLTTSLNVTDACFEVGYNSLGSFSSRFKEFVGVSPNQLRRLLDTVIQPHTRLWLQLPAQANGPAGPGAITIGKVVGPSSSGPIVVGLFENPLPQGRPVACAVLSQPGPCALSAPPPDGRYYVFAVALRWSEEPIHYALLPGKEIQVGMAGGPLLISRRQATHKVEITLRPRRLIDPPLLVDLLTLLQEKGYLHDDSQAVAGEANASAPPTEAVAARSPALVRHLPRFVQRDRPGAAET